MSACFPSSGPSIRQAALAVSFSGTLLTGATAWAEPAVQGIPAKTEATAIDQDAIASAAAGRKEGSLELGTTTISSVGLGATTEGTGSYTTGSANTATGLRLSTRETPQSVSVVTRQQIEDQNLTEVAQVLEQTPGVVVDSMGPAGSDANHIYVRGFEIGSIQVDGVNRPDTYGFRDDLADTVTYDRVEVVRGATGLMSGTGDPGATVNLIRKKPTFGTQRSLTLKAGSWDNYWPLGGRTPADLVRPVGLGAFRTVFPRAPALPGGQPLQGLLPQRRLPAVVVPDHRRHLHLGWLAGDS